MLLLVGLTASGCVHTSAPNVTATAQSEPPQPTDLDSLAYARRVTPPSAAYAQAQPRPLPAMQPPPVITAAQFGGPVPVAVPIPAGPAYTLDTGDKLRIVVFGQDGLSNSYFLDAAGQVTVPLIGVVNARGLTTQQLARAIAQKLRNGFVREPHVAIEIETYRPFFILGEVTFPGQYPYVPNMTVETAVAIAGGYTPRAYRWDVKIDRPTEGGALRSRASVPLLTRVRPGDTIIIKERWF